MIRIKIRANTTASVTLPNAQLESVKEPGKTLTALYKNAKAEWAFMKLDIGSGDYIFQYPYPK